jgi:hypothetical protein
VLGVTVTIHSLPEIAASLPLLIMKNQLNRTEDDRAAVPGTIIVSLSALLESRRTESRSTVYCPFILMQHPLGNSLVRYTVTAVALSTWCFVTAEYSATLESTPISPWLPLPPPAPSLHLLEKPGTPDACYNTAGLPFEPSRRLHHWE